MNLRLGFFVRLVRIHAMRMTSKDKEVEREGWRGGFFIARASTRATENKVFGWLSRSGGVTQRAGTTSLVLARESEHIVSSCA